MRAVSSASPLPKLIFKLLTRSPFFATFVVGAHADAATQQKWAEGDEHLQSSIVTWTLFSITALSLIVGFVILGVTAYAAATVKVYNATAPLIALSVLIITISIFGVAAARKHATHGPSCWALMFFYSDLVLVIFLIYLVAYNLAFSSWKDSIDKYWDSISDAIPSSYKGAGVHP